ncbi:hypothetical protein [Streptomyces sp. NPDC058739]|uniref:hypothetical protein n=1 Tax=Streptomyces sp. NPDC058739 TaxID=3346618 RepID=UPI0036CBAC82
MPLLSFRRQAGTSAAPAVLHAESILVEQYAALVRLAHLVLPASMGRHRRVLVAHGIVQRALPGGSVARVGPAVPAPRRATSPADEALRRLRVRVVRDALAHARRGARLPRLPFVVGLRLFPSSGGAQESALTPALAQLSAPGRAAFALRRLDGLPEAAVRELLGAAGTGDVDAALREAAGLDAGEDDAGEDTGSSRLFDACAMQAGPTDLLRRRRLGRLTGAVGAALLVTGAVLAVAGPAGTGPADPDTARTAVVAPGELTRTPPDAWADTSRVDFTAWPPRGGRVRDEALLNRALTAWSAPRDGTRTAYAPATAHGAPAQPPQLLYAGEVAGRALVLLFDGLRLARYGEPLRAAGKSPDTGTNTLDVARADDADVTGAAAVTLHVRDGAARYLLAPWVAEAATRDLFRPDVPARPLGMSPSGVTEPVPVIPTSAGCPAEGTVLQLRSSARIVEDHSFLLAGTGDLSPVHLTYTPPPGHGTPPARQPREATGPAALVAWSRLGCRLGSLHGTGVSAVNAWDFAEQRLPDGGGIAVWTCSRADTWRGAGDVTLTLRTAGEPVRVTGTRRSTAACSRFGQHVATAAPWRSPSGHDYVLAAGSRAVTGLTVTGDVNASRDGHTLAVRAPKDAAARVTARLTTGGTLTGITS